MTANVHVVDRWQPESFLIYVDREGSPYVAPVGAEPPAVDGDRPGGLWIRIGPPLPPPDPTHFHITRVTARQPS